MAKQVSTDEAPRSKRTRRELLAGAAGALAVVAADSLVSAPAANAGTDAERDL
jgi:hypothetical protein